MRPPCILLVLSQQTSFLGKHSQDACLQSFEPPYNGVRCFGDAILTADQQFGLDIW